MNVYDVHGRILAKKWKCNTWYESENTKTKIHKTKIKSYVCIIHVFGWVCQKTYFRLLGNFNKKHKRSQTIPETSHATRSQFVWLLWSWQHLQWNQNFFSVIDPGDFFSFFFGAFPASSRSCLTGSIWKTRGLLHTTLSGDVSWFVRASFTYVVDWLEFNSSMNIENITESLYIAKEYIICTQNM